jgi:hypothetical protein
MVRSPFACASVTAVAERRTRGVASLFQLTVLILWSAEYCFEPGALSKIERWRSAPF